MQSTIRRGAAVFAVLGALLAAELASLFRVGCFDHDDGLALFVLPVLVPCVMAALGCVLSWVVAQPPRLERALGVAVLVPATGMLTGLVGGLVWWPDDAAEAAVDGLALGAVVLVLIVPVLRSLAGRARAGSVVDAADSYATWAQAGLVAAVGSVLTLPQWKAYPACESEPAQAVVATAASAAVAVAASVLLLVHVLRSRRALSRPVASIDLGVGDARTELLAHQPTAYRHPVTTVATIWGDPDAARATLRARARSGLLCAALAVAAAGAGVLMRL